MAEPTLSMDADDDLPRTIRRERDAKAAREREARERDARERLSMEPPPMPNPAAIRSFERPAHFKGQQAPPYGFATPAGSAAILDVPFSKLMAFFIKAALAAVPAFVVLAATLWVAGYGVHALFPDLVKLKVLIYMPK